VIASVIAHYIPMMSDCLPAKLQTVLVIAKYVVL